MTQPTASSATPTRRHVVKGAMWAVPAIAVASQVPAFAASPLVQLTLTAKCRYTNNSSGKKGSVTLSATYENKTNQEITVTPQQGTLIAGGTTRTGGFTYAGSPGGVTIPAGPNREFGYGMGDKFCRHHPRDRTSQEDSTCQFSVLRPECRAAR